MSSIVHSSSIIAKKSMQKKRKYIVQNDYSPIENTASTSSSSQKPNSSNECSESNIISKLLPVKVVNPYLKHENKDYDSLIICEFCGSHSYKKELHNNDSIKANESGQANSNK
ncbi:26788_t:CDS:2, partial [Gigaspora margarita]